MILYRTVEATPHTPVIDYKVQLSIVLFDVEVTNKSFMENKITEPSCHTAHMDVLFSSGRKIHKALGDGNCLFRTFSRELLSNEMHHLRICTLLTDTIKWNADGIPDPTSHRKVHNRACTDDAEGVYLGNSHRNLYNGICLAKSNLPLHQENGIW